MAVRSSFVTIGNLSTDVHEPWTPTGSGMFPLLGQFCFSSQRGKLVFKVLMFVA